jgi:uncharacterized protein (DUF433 family)
MPIWKYRPLDNMSSFFCNFNLKLIAMKWNERITLESGKRSGKPCIRGMRITVADVLGYLAAGMSFEEILDDFPYLEREDILACLSYAANKGKIELCA